MAEYIDKEKLLKYLEETNTSDEWIVNQYNADWIYSFIESQPCADVVEVVRCGQCKHFGHRSIGLLGEIVGSCYNNDFPFVAETRPCLCENDFCSYGERRNT